MRITSRCRISKRCFAGFRRGRWRRGPVMAPRWVMTWRISSLKRSVGRPWARPSRAWPSASRARRKRLVMAAVRDDRIAVVERFGVDGLPQGVAQASIPSPCLAEMPTTPSGSRHAAGALSVLLTTVRSFCPGRSGKSGAGTGPVSVEASTI